ncbi:MAG TPA: HAD-IA family hydrolase [Gemmataceae bacterium]|nr:HAD-IA family hydrolase [Gemmataceae bacterium]
MQIHQLRAVIFDFDGTLADSYAAIAASVNHVRTHHQLPSLTVDEVKQHVGRGPHHLLEHTVGTKNVNSDIARYKAHHPSVMRSLTHLLPGATAALEAAKRKGLQTAICSNKPRVFTAELLKSLEITGLVDLVIGPEDVTRVKPAPDMLLLALVRLGLTAAEVLYIGDMTVDIQTARAAGITVWTVPTGSDTLEALAEARPDRLLCDLSELAHWLSAG